MQTNKIWREDVTGEAGNLPLMATAIHDGHLLRDDLAGLVALDSDQRLREEDPFTGEWTAVAPTRVVGLASRFQVDLNRPRDGAVYQRPEQAWGLKVWKSELPEEAVSFSLDEYDEFYDGMFKLFTGFTKRFGRFVVFDLHTYNHRRDGADAPAANAEANPQVNIGTGTMERARWGGVVDRFISDLGAFDFPGGALDVRENIKFRGGQFARWAHEKFPESACVLSIEFKKFFMDEWTGEPDRVLVDAIGEALRSTVAGVKEAVNDGS